MVRIPSTVLGACISILVLASSPAQDPEEPKLRSRAGGSARLLFLTHSTGATHTVIKRGEDDKPALAERCLVEAARGYFQVEATQDCALLCKEALAEYDGLILYSAGQLPIDDAQQAALIAFVRDGGAFVGIHSAIDALLSRPEYGEMMGGSLDGQPWNQEVTIKVEQPTHPAVAHLGKSFRFSDEIFQFKNWSREGLQVLMNLDTSTVEIGKNKRPDGDYALAWCRDFGQGRVFYTALGHRQEVWSDQRFLRHLLCGTLWALDARAQLSIPPPDAIHLVGTEHWQHANGKPCNWSIVEAALRVHTGSGSILTKHKYGDCYLHVEFRTPPPIGDNADPAHGNSGVYVQTRYEIQILDSFGQPPKKDGCGAIYNFRAPDLNASRPAGEWQSFDMDFHAPRFDETGKKTANARISVVHNGIIVHNRIEIPNKTGNGRPEAPGPGQLMLQDHNSSVEFRNVWIK